MTADPESDLLPCPFCGCERIQERGFRRFECPACRAEGPPMKTRAEAITAWNTRSEGPQPPAEVVTQARKLLSQVRSGAIDPRPAAEALGLRFDQDVLTAILEAASGPQPPAVKVEEGMRRRVREILRRTITGDYVGGVYGLESAADALVSILGSRHEG